MLSLAQKRTSRFAKSPEAKAEPETLVPMKHLAGRLPHLLPISVDRSAETINLTRAEWKENTRTAECAASHCDETWLQSKSAGTSDFLGFDDST